jgi:hypothetical protein
MTRGKAFLFRACGPLVLLFVVAGAPDARSQNFTPQTDPRPVLSQLIQAFQNCGPPQVYQWLGLALFQTISAQTGNSGCYANIRSAGFVTNMAVTGVQMFPAGPVFSVRVNHQTGVVADWFIGFSNFTGKVEYLNYQAAVNSGPAPTPQTVPSNRGEIPNPPSQDNRPQPGGCEKFPGMCS